MVQDKTYSFSKLINMNDFIILGKEKCLILGI